MNSNTFFIKNPIKIISLLLCLTSAVPCFSNTALAPADTAAVIPNVFTPDGDGINDFFYIENITSKEFKLEIYNRWGTQVFESSLADLKWDGRSTAGLELSDGTYFYIVKFTFNNEAVLQKGNISLFRNRK